MFRAIYRRVARAINRAAIERRVRDWGDRLEQLDRQRRTHDGNVELATTEMYRAKRELAALDAPPVRVAAAPRLAPREGVDGVRRFSLVD